MKYYPRNPALIGLPFTFFSLTNSQIGLNPANEFIEDNLVSKTTPYTNYYNDISSNFRTPDWMKQQGFGDLLNPLDPGKQKLGTWNSKNAAISLGNGKTASSTTEVASTPAQKEFIDSIKKYYQNKDHRRYIRADIFWSVR